VSVPVPISRLRGLGVFEDWLARPPDDPALPPLVVVRRVSSSARAQAVLEARLALGASLARRVDHPDVILPLDCPMGPHGGRCSEAVAGIDLAQLLEARRDRPAALPVAAAVWVALQLAGILAQAHAAGVWHGALGASQVRLDRDGRVRLDAGLALGDPGRAEALSGSRGPELELPARVRTLPVSVRRDLASVIFLAARLTGRLDASGDPRATAPTLPVTPPDDLERLLDPGLAPADARTLESALERAFYRTLDADDERDGRAVLAAAVEATLPAAEDPVLLLWPANAPTEAPPPGPGSFTDALEAWKKPLWPRDLTTGDAVKGLDTWHGVPAASASRALDVADTVAIEVPAAMPPAARAPPATRLAATVDGLAWLLYGFIAVAIALAAAGACGRPTGGAVSDRAPRAAPPAAAPGP
jgi:hypothetical protein